MRDEPGEQLKNLVLLIAASVTLLVLSSKARSDENGERGWKLDPLSYAIGNFSTFAEIVDIGIKKMALSQALPPAEMDRLEREVRKIADQWDVEIHREPDFLITDLFPESATAGKDVLIIYRGDTLDEYTALKRRQAELVAAGEYDEAARREEAWSLGKLLSYPDEKIEQLLAE
jgi:hypothetical protein